MEILTSATLIIISEYQIDILYTLNLYKVICELCLTKPKNINAIPICQ